MHRLCAFVATAALLVSLSNAGQASSIEVATSTGTLAIHYNSTGGEVPTNIAYVKAQFSPTNTNGAQLTFLPPFQPIFGDVGQFGFDLVEQLPTSNGSVPTPTLTAVDYNGVGPVPAGNVTWATNGYGQNVPVGPGNPANIPYNSLFRGNGVQVTSASLTQLGTVFTLTLAGNLISDGFIHWYDPSAGSTSLASLGISNVFTFTGTYTYDSALDTTPGIDYYTGTTEFFAQTTPEPTSLVLLASAAGVGLIVRRRLQKKSATVAG